MMLKAAICDPQLTVGMPPAITMGTGMDALAHRLEAFCAPSYHPMAEGIAVEGMRPTFANLPKAVTNGQDLEARAHMMSAAAMGATAFQKGLGALFMRCPTWSARSTTPITARPTACSCLMCSCSTARRSRRRSSALQAFSRSTAGSTGSWLSVLDLRKKTGVPHDLKGLGVDGSRVDTIVEMSLVDPTAGGNPVPLTKEGSRKLFDAALKGDVAAAAA